MNYYKKNEFTHELTKEAKALTFKVEATVTAEQIENIIVDSLEAQSTFWLGLDNTTPEWIDEPDDLPASQYATQLILEGKTVTLYDIEDEDEVWTLTLDKLLKGIAIAMSNGEDIEDEADSVMQYALFGELVFG